MLRKSNLSLLLMFGAVLILAILLPEVTRWKNARTYSTQRIERILEEELRELDHTLIELGQGATFSGKQGEEMFRESGQAYFHFRGDSLVWWSTDAVPVPSEEKIGSVAEGLTFNANGYYLGQVRGEGDDRWLGMILVYRDYSYRNAYLPQSFHPVFRLPDNARLRFTPDRGGIHTTDGKYLFSVWADDGSKPGIPGALATFLWFIAYALLLALLYRSYLLLIHTRWRNLLIPLGFSVDAILVRLLLLWFRFPGDAYALEIFQPQYFASSVLAPSLGDMALHALTVVWIAWVWYRHIPRIDVFPALGRVGAFLLTTITQLFLLGLFLLASIQIGSLVLNSSIAFDLNDLLSLDEYSLVGFGAIFLFLSAFFLLGYRLTARIVLPGRALDYFLIPLVALVLAFSLSPGPAQRAIVIVYVMVSGIWWWYHGSARQKNMAAVAVVFLMLFSGLLTIILESSLRQREQEKRRLIAIRLTQQRDQVGEYIFREVAEDMRLDTTLQSLVSRAVQEGQDARVKEYLDQNYIRDYWQRYEISVTICAAGRLLAVQPSGYIVDCGEYFNGLIRDLGKSTVTDSLYYLDLGGDNSGYLSLMEFDDVLPGGLPVRLYLEIFPRHIPKGLGYPELLIDQAWMPEDISEYSYAVYRDGELTRRVGSYFYSLRDAAYLADHINGEFFSLDGYNHYLRVVDARTTVVLSRPEKTTLDLAAPFSYLLVFAALLLILFYVVGQGRGNGVPWALNLRSRLQFSMVAVILFTFVVVAASSLWYLVRINQNKNQDSLSEKAHSVLVEIEHKLADRDKLQSTDRQVLEQLLTKFSLVFFSDINMYDPQGELLASSRSRIFEEGLIGTRMNAEAWEYMNTGRSLVILEERIGNYVYLSAYLPFRNNRNELLAYLNLPYFARQAELRQEISDFMVAIINIYVVLIALTLAAALFISNLFTSPLQLIREKIRKVRLGSANERIEWQRGDEIGALVDEYNRMVDALADSAETLARTERETAWREMARQVAHEIKNPLTPMKLSVQYLQKAWDEKADDWDERLQRFTSTLSEQIDTLSDIATAFSDFARMPGNESVETDLARVARHAIDTFSEGQPERIRLLWDESGDYTVIADPRQLLRVFNNLIKNALQATADAKEGLVSVDIRRQGGHFLVSVADNGPGIPPDKQDKIFVPNFTTKSSGTGLGLAMTRNLVIAHGGRIWYETETGRGTTFHFTIPGKSLK